MQKTQENRREFVRYAMEIIHARNRHLEIFSLSQAIENSMQFCFSDQIFNRKQLFGAPVTSFLWGPAVTRKSWVNCKMLAPGIDFGLW